LHVRDDLTRGHALLRRKRRRHSDSLPARDASQHDAARATDDVAGGAIAAGDVKIGYVARIERPERDLVDARWLHLCARGSIEIHEAQRSVLIQAPPPKRHGVGERPSLHDVVLYKNMVSDSAPTFAFPRERRHPLEIEVLVPVAPLRTVLNVVPDAI